MTQRHGQRPPSQRQLRVGEEIRHVLSAVLQRGDFRDPALQGLSVTVTEVRLSPDLRAATVFVTPLGGGAIAETVKALRHAAGFLRGQVAQEVNLRYAPMLSFEADVSFDYAARIDTLLHRPEVVRDIKPDAADKADKAGQDEAARSGEADGGTQA